MNGEVDAHGLERLQALKEKALLRSNFPEKGVQWMEKCYSLGHRDKDPLEKLVNEFFLRASKMRGERTRQSKTHKKDR